MMMGMPNRPMLSPDDLRLQLQGNMSVPGPISAMPMPGAGPLPMPAGGGRGMMSIDGQPYAKPNDAPPQGGAIGGAIPSSTPRRAPTSMFGNSPLAALSAPSIAPGQPLALPEMPATPRVQPHFFDKGGLGSKFLRGLGEFALQYSAGNGNPAAMATLQNRAFQQRQGATWEREDAQRDQEHRWAIEEREAKLKAPQYFQSGRDRVRLDPVTGNAEIVYDGLEDYQNYAAALGLNPDDPAYGPAMQDFVLGSNGPTSTANRLALQDDRQEGQYGLEGYRQNNRLQLRQTPLPPRAGGGRAGNAGGGGRMPTMAGTVAPIIAKVARGEQLTPAEQQAWSMYRPPSQSRGQRGVSPAVASPSSQSRGGEGGREPVLVRTAADAAKLPKGTPFVTPDGRRMVRR